MSCSAQATSQNTTSPDVKPGSVIEKVDKGYAAERAGLRSGDLLLHWSGRNGHGNIDWPFDLAEIEAEHSPYGPIKIEGIRGKRKHIWTIQPDYWGILARPNFSPHLLLIYKRVLDVASTGKPFEAVEQWESAVAAGPGLQSSQLKVWFLFHQAESLAAAAQWAESDPLYQRAIAEAQTLKPIVRIKLLWRLAANYGAVGDWINAERIYERAKAESYDYGHVSFTYATSLSYLGGAASGAGELDKTKNYLTEALAVQKRLAPLGSADMGRVLTNLMTVFWMQGDLIQADQCTRSAIDVLRQFNPASTYLPAALDDLGIIAWERGDLMSAEQNFRQVRKMYHKGATPHWGLRVAQIMQNLGIVMRDQGKLITAGRYLRRSLQIAETLNPGRYATTDSLIAADLNSLGVLAHRRGELSKAEEYLRRSLAIREQKRGNDKQLFDVLFDLADVLRDRNNLAGAEDYYRRALATEERLAPGSRHHAEVLGALAEIMRLKHQEQEAENLYEQSLTALENQTSHLGGGDEVRFDFRARYESYYKDYLDLLIAQNQPERAFDVLERSRSRSLAEALTAAHIDIHTGVDAELLHQERSLREKLTTKSNYRIRLLGAKHTEDQAKALDKEVAELLSRYQEVEEQIRLSSPAYAALTQPQPLRATEVQEHLLDEDTVLLEYSLGKERSHLFALTPTTLNSYELPARSEIESAARHVYDLLTARNHGVRGETKPQRRIRLHSLDAAYERATAQLSRMILGPAAAELQKKRLLIVADGALAYIPFPALPSPQTSASTAAVPLVAEHEIIDLPSASVLALLRQQEQGRKPATKAVAVLADPVFSKDDSRVSAGTTPSYSQRPITAKAQGPRETFNDEVPLHLLLRSAADTGLQRGRQLHLSRLPYTRQEATAIAAVVPADQGMQALDFRASRETAMSADLGQYRIVHFATHGLLNSRNPELSGLVLSLVDQLGRPSDGFLQLQDIYNLTLAADLVVLSACETALGKQVEGEGLIGLTRGFMYAGASRVMSSLWRVDDEATAQLMKKFYEAVLRDGKTPAAALREAQMWMRTQKAWSSPYYWAGFVLQGEWK